MRTQDNEALGILKLVEGNTEYTTILNEDIIANYVYIDKGVEINNMKFKVEITEENLENNDNKENRLVLQDEFKSDKGIEITISKEGVIKLNGKTSQKLFIKITNGINIVYDGNENIELIKREPEIFKKQEKIYIDVKEIDGRCIATNSIQQFNVVLRYRNGNIVANCKTRSGIFKQEATLEDDITGIYLYASENMTFENYIMNINVY